MRHSTVDLFAGCGGLARGLRWAGFDCIAFNELNEDAADSFAANFSDAIPLVGDIKRVMSKKAINENILPAAGDRGVDLICGGPPCQGFSGIGHRRSYSVEKTEIPTNDLYHEMINVIHHIQPKAFLFENVQGLLSSKWSKKGERGEIFREVLKSFSNIEGYVAQPTLLHAYGFGVPQNRPRVFIMGIEEGIAEKSDFVPTHFDPECHASKYPSLLRNNGGFFPEYNGSKAPDIIDVISDLAYEGWKKGDVYKFAPSSEYQEKMRARLGEPWEEQVLTDHQVSNHTSKVRNRFKYMIDRNIANIRDLPEDMQTEKFSQKVLPSRWEGNPSITCCSNSDDYIHYARPRALSVREWARLQSFPDHHIFCGPRTTGGVRRAGNPDKGDWRREVPKYTQIGNAVPPLVGQAIGKRIKQIIRVQE